MRYHARQPIELPEQCEDDDDVGDLVAAAVAETMQEAYERRWLFEYPTPAEAAQRGGAKAAAAPHGDTPTLPTPRGGDDRSFSDEKAPFRGSSLGRSGFNRPNASDYSSGSRQGPSSRYSRRPALSF